MREITFGNYRTHTDGLWTLTGCQFGDPSFLQNFVVIQGRAAPLDLSGALSEDGEPTYDNRMLTATFESSEGKRDERTTRISYVKNTLDGRKVQIVLPDFPDHFLMGRVVVRELYNDLAHCSIQIEAICDPWFYSVSEKVVSASAESVVTLTNTGRMKVTPLVEVNGDIQLTFGETSWSGTTGTYQIPALRLGADSVEVSVTGSGSVEFTWREGIL